MTRMFMQTSVMLTESSQMAEMHTYPTSLH